MSAPPVEDGGVNATDAEASPAVATKLVGAPGVVRGITADDETDATLSPRALVAFTLNV